MSDKKITYLLGAGASYNACPILNELGEKMIEMAETHLPELDAKFDYNYNIEGNNITRNNSINILQDIGSFGVKACEFGTIDTYAKKLSLNHRYASSLQRLKLALSIFFVLWDNTDSKIKERKNEDKDKEALSFKNIDLRYISLLATFLEKGKDNFPKMNENIKFISWNYDLQLEKAFKAFIIDDLKVKTDNVDYYFKFKHNTSEAIQNLDLLHLNGYSGYYYVNDNKNNQFKEQPFLYNNNSKNLIKVLKKSIEYMNRKSFRVDVPINFAWENNELAQKKREYAKSVFQNSDVVVVIGYSFPPFNRRIDQMLFNELKGRKTKVYYQDPKASRNLIKTFINPEECEVRIIKDRHDQFFVPYEF